MGIFQVTLLLAPNKENIEIDVLSFSVSMFFISLLQHTDCT